MSPAINEIPIIINSKNDVGTLKINESCYNNLYTDILYYCLVFIVVT